MTKQSTLNRAQREGMDANAFHRSRYDRDTPAALADSALPRSLAGIVIKGDQRGRTLGFPTANIDIGGADASLRQGVYAVWVELDGPILPGVAAYGKPMFSTHQPPLETHIFDFSGDIYGRQIIVTLVSFLRESKVFTSLGELIASMHEDARHAREILALNRAVHHGPFHASTDTASPDRMDFQWFR